jgi:hypothetical protein
MKMLIAKLAIATSVAFAALAATSAAYAHPSRHHVDRAFQSRAAAMTNNGGQGRYNGGQGYYEGNYEFNVDRSDPASSPYAGGP